MAAGVAESDMDLAFRLQLEEAIAASIPFSSTSSTQSQHPPILISDDDAESNPDYPQIMEIDRLETAIQDRMPVESETTKNQIDFQRRIHRKKRARDMPEDECQVLGEGCSSSKVEEHSDAHRVYFKGLLSDESGSTQTLAGIGVAIYNSTDELIFEISKPLDLVEDGEVSRRYVEGMALIEALKAAAVLDLERIILYCHSRTVYHYVNRLSPSKQEKLRTIFNQVNHLRKSFTYCAPVPAARIDVKSALKLAREAIISHINKLEQCVICLDDKSMDQFFSIEGCKHRYCFSCMKQHVEVKLLHGMLPNCPHEGCEFELSIENCEILTPKLAEMMRQMQKEASIPVTKKIYCPYPKCSTLMSKTELLLLPRSIIGHGARTCYKCRGDLCIDCKVPWHKNMDCAGYKRKNPIPLVEESKLKKLAAKKLWRQCIKCKHMIELAAGCYHITCRCGFEFCYKCGAEWKNKKATCACPLWDENLIFIRFENEDEDEDDEIQI